MQHTLLHKRSINRQILRSISRQIREVCIREVLFSNIIAKRVIFDVCGDPAFTSENVTFRTCLQVHNGTHYGKTKRHFKTRISEHLGISHPTGKKIKIESSKLSAIQEHLLLQLLSIL